MTACLGCKIATLLTGMHIRSGLVLAVVGRTGIETCAICLAVRALGGRARGVRRTSTEPATALVPPRLTCRLLTPSSSSSACGAWRQAAFLRTTCWCMSPRRICGSWRGRGSEAPAFINESWTNGGQCAQGNCGCEDLVSSGNWQVDRPPRRLRVALHAKSARRAIVMFAHTISEGVGLSGRRPPFHDIPTTYQLRIDRYAWHCSVVSTCLNMARSFTN
eukprot:4632300-Pleurochrysis_carterae.AAC.7